MVTRQAPSPSVPPTASAPSKVAMIGDGISVTGDVNANSNLKVEGRIEGRGVSSSQDIEVAESGVIKASITAKVIRIAGAVAGDLSASEKVVISKSGRVQGNIVAPRVQLDDGALFRGSIDMNPAEPAQASKPAVAKPAAEARPASPAPKPAQGDKSSAPGAKKEPGLTLKSG
ncbi:MAG: polymer-forming cytoskeletal protein [Xanthomonadales bacterium]|nr:polymer-forming cytoskeletal protein [Xanthomonadales bacterium]